IAPQPVMMAPPRIAYQPTQARIAPNPQAKIQFDAQQEYMQEMQAKYEDQMQAAKKRHIEQMKPCKIQAPIAQ
ncbi:MAG: hypothetical protein KAI02_05685, partial [Gammaproteobacteria bacterium]|nr:hypothetical protein [Gammaproteobacteria bacterium]